jgi:toxin CptA
MEIALTSLAFVLAAGFAGLMGFAIQRGATCTVAAMDEVVSGRGTKRLLSLFEAAAWVAGGLLVAQALRMLPTMPAGYPLNRWTVVGGALLGLGAYINRACVFGAIARFGSGEWSYLATPLGFYVGCVTAAPLFALPAPAKLSYGSPVLQAPDWVALLFVAFVIWRLARLPWRRGRAALAAHVWSPHTATTVIGISFLFMLLLVGAWAYTDVLAELARGMAASLAARGALLVALLLGAALGGWTAGRFRSSRLAPGQMLQCFLGGVLMGWGSLLIPGGNDGLILVGMPLLWPYAWVAFAAMCATIAAALVVQARRAPPVAA